jgi:hypothetical protein
MMGLIEEDETVEQQSLDSIGECMDVVGGGSQVVELKEIKHVPFSGRRWQEPSTKLREFLSRTFPDYLSIL